MREPVAMPYEIRLADAGRTLKILWDERDPVVLDSAALRGACRCASCERARADGAAPSGDGVRIDRVEVAGVSALQLFFSDDHSRGRFPWRYLLELGGADV